MKEEMDRPDPALDRAELARMAWVAEARIVESAHALTEQDGLDPSLAEQVEGAIREGGRAELDLALARLLEAVAQARGLAP